MVQSGGFVAILASLLRCAPGARIVHCNEQNHRSNRPSVAPKSSLACYSRAGARLIWASVPGGVKSFPRGGAVWQLVGLITQRSKVQILPPQPTKIKGFQSEALFFLSATASDESCDELRFSPSPRSSSKRSGAT